MARVRLLDCTGADVIASGEIDEYKLIEASWLIRGDLHYRYVGMRDGGALTFQECEPPYVIAEF